MKKIIFSAILATVAIGGAVTSVSAITYYTDKDVSPRVAYHCDGGVPSCATTIGSQTVYTSPTEQSSPVTLIPGDLTLTNQSPF